MGTRGRRGVPAHIRARILRRDHGLCQLQYLGCLELATEIDDIVNVSSLGVSRDQVDDDNRQAICAAWHAVKSERERLAAWQAYQQRRRERRHLPAPHPGEWR